MSRLAMLSGTLGRLGRMPSCAKATDGERVEEAPKESELATG